MADSAARHALGNETRNREKMWGESVLLFCVTKGNVTLPVIGGRDGGYRTYTVKSYLTRGRWRVNVETTQGQVIGRILFNVIPVEVEPHVLTKINE